MYIVVPVHCFSVVEMYTSHKIVLGTANSEGPGHVVFPFSVGIPSKLKMWWHFVISTMSENFQSLARNYPEISLFCH